MVRGRVDRTDEPLAKRFSREMKRSMKESGIGSTELARQVRCGQPMMHRYVTGKTIPMLDRAKILSELLANEKLLTIAQEWAQRICAMCGIKFYTANVQMKAKYCSPNCKGIAYRKQRSARSAMSSKFALERVKTYQRLVELAQEDERTKSNMIAWLINREYERRHPKPEEPIEQAS